MKQTIIMKQEKQCKGSIRYKATEVLTGEGPDRAKSLVTVENPAALDTVYLSRSFFNPMPAQITVTVEA